MSVQRRSPVVALPADMDDLPSQEENEVAYASIVKGLMHARGRDLHMACLLGAAQLLVGYQTQISGRVKLIFQPSEEIGTDAQAMIAMAYWMTHLWTSFLVFTTIPDWPRGRLRSDLGR